MNKKVILSVVTASILFTGCGDNDGHTPIVDSTTTVDDTQEVAIVDNTPVVAKEPIVITPIIKDTPVVGTPPIEDIEIEDTEEPIVEPIVKEEEPKVVTPYIPQPTENVITGYAIDGAIKGARVYLDANNNNAYDEGELKTITDATGRYEFKFKTDVIYDISIVVDGGIDTVTGENFEGVLQKRYQKGDNLENLMVTPSSTLVDTFVKKEEMTLKDARVKVAKFLEIEEEDIIKNPTIDVKLYKINLMILEWIKRLDNGFEELAEDIKDTTETINTFKNDKIYILDAVYVEIQKITKVPKAGEGNGNIDDMPTPEPLDPQVVVDKIKDSLDILGKNSALDNITTNLNLKPIVNHRAVNLSFTTTSDAIDIETGKVTRPAFGQEDINTTITATITKDEATATKDFEVTIKSLPKVEDTEVQGAVDKTKALYTWENIISDRSDTPDNLKNRLILPNNGKDDIFENGITVKYISENDRLMIPNCCLEQYNDLIEVFRKTIMEETTGAFKIEIYYNQELKETITYDITVAITERDKVLSSGYLILYNFTQNSLEKIDENTYLKDDITSIDTTNDYNIPFECNSEIIDNTSLNYISSDIITKDCKIIPQKEDIQITNLTFSSPNMDISLPFISPKYEGVFIIKGTGDTALEDAKEALDFDDIKNTNSDSENVTTDLNLINSLDGFEDVDISWESNNTTAINPSTGGVTQGAENTPVTLTATLSKDGKEESKVIPITVIASQSDDNIPSF